MLARSKWFVICTCIIQVFYLLIFCLIVLSVIGSKVSTSLSILVKLFIFCSSTLDFVSHILGLYDLGIF